jgi:hypothetical protein
MKMANLDLEFKKAEDLKGVMSNVCVALDNLDKPWPKIYDCWDFTYYGSEVGSIHSDYNPYYGKRYYNLFIGEKKKDSRWTLQEIFQELFGPKIEGDSEEKANLYLESLKIIHKHHVPDKPGKDWKVKSVKEIKCELKNGEFVLTEKSDEEVEEEEKNKGMSMSQLDALQILHGILPREVYHEFIAASKRSYNIDFLKDKIDDKTFKTVSEKLKITEADEKKMKKKD